MDKSSWVSILTLKIDATQIPFSQVTQLYFLVLEFFIWHENLEIRLETDIVVGVEAEVINHCWLNSVKPVQERGRLTPAKKQWSRSNQILVVFPNDDDDVSMTPEVATSSEFLMIAATLP